ncbi:unnamed protein product [Phytomonas sp. Hart1]|nr:unnamed protein product [Phytomonas sp. Hart1]|eukprot:CCW71525.1 unnamed protein product [Phytomonas sp. isolate Hart1]
MVLLSEIGDKTFFIACLMSMRHSKLSVYIGAVSALAAMTIFSTLMGIMVPNVVSVRVTQVLAAFLFFTFGIKILYGELMSKKNSGEENEDELAEAAAALRRRDPLDAVETGSAGTSVYTSPSAKRWRKFLNPVMVEAFTLIFLAEWGDRSQIATIALAASKNAYAVTVGGILGHAICTCGAVLCGKIIAQRVSIKSVNILGGILFIFFGLGTLYEVLTRSHEIEKTHQVNPIPK